MGFLLCKKLCSLRCLQIGRWIRLSGGGVAATHSQSEDYDLGLLLMGDAVEEDTTLSRPTGRSVEQLLWNALIVELGATGKSHHRDKYR